MPRKAHIDAPGALHYVICRGIELRKVFWSYSGRDDFIERLGRFLRDTDTACYGWALLANHFHLLLRTGNTPIAYRGEAIAVSPMAVRHRSCQSLLRPI